MAWSKLDICNLGGLHGLAQIMENMLFPKKYRKSKGIIRGFRVVGVFCFCSFAWIFFASNSFGDALFILKHMFDGIIHPVDYLQEGFRQIGLGMRSFSFLAVSLLLLLAFDYISLKKDVIEIISSKKILVRWSIYVIFVLWVIFNVPITDTTEFIYFQF